MRSKEEELGLLDCRKMLQTASKVSLPSAFAIEQFAS